MSLKIHLSPNRKNRIWLVTGYFGTKNNGPTRSKCRWSIVSSRPLSWHVWSHIGEKVRINQKVIKRTRTYPREFLYHFSKYTASFRTNSCCDASLSYFFFNTHSWAKREAGGKKQQKKMWNLLIPSRPSLVKTQSEPLKRFWLLSSLKSIGCNFPKVQHLVIPCSQRKNMFGSLNFPLVFEKLSWLQLFL